MKTVIAYRWRLRPYTIIQGLDGAVVKAYSASRALRMVPLTPGAKVKVWLPVIVHSKRAPRSRRAAA